MRAPALFAGIALLAGFATLQYDSVTATPPQQPGCASPEYRQFDFWVGEWDVTTPAGQTAGRNRITRILDGCVLLEEWTGAAGGTGRSFNMYDRTEQKWHQTWVSSNGTLLKLDGEFRDGRMMLEGATKRPDGSTALQRITWSLIDGSPDRIRQFWEQSTDGGKTWTVAFDGTYTRRGS